MNFLCNALTDTVLTDIIPSEKGVVGALNAGPVNILEAIPGRS